ncbi:MAG: response regulator transcription factor [Planctomycetes bacterium]|nr:response regulator transcription factor [Planctomycetota bacterium]
MARMRVLIVDDEEDIRELVELYLGRDGYDILTCETGEQALEIVRMQSPDLMVLDLMLPGISGLEVCKKLKASRKTESMPIVMLTAKGEDTDVVTGLELGADDYVTKPFSGKVLAARVRRILKRADTDDQEMPVIEIDNLIIDPARRDVRFKGQSIKLTFTEFNILWTLARRPGIVFTRYKIVDAIRGTDYLVTDRAVDVQIVSLRKKLKECGDTIETVRGVGYRFKD